MIPKIIHYSWIGTPMPKHVQDRVDEWKRILPDWEFMFWDESNYNFDKFEFTSKKIANKEWGFAADELRYDVINKYGGFYLDTDMIIKKDLSPLLKYNGVWGFMYDNNLLTSFFGSVPNSPILEYILNEYSNKKNMQDLMNMTSNPFVTNLFLKKFNTLKMDGSLQKVDNNVAIFPRDYFCYPSRNREANFLEHLFDNTWGNSKKGIKGISKLILRAMFPIAYSNLSNKRGVKYSKKFLK